MQYIAFLRGINVGGRIVKMDDLRTCFRDLGLRNVHTVLQTGNVVFESDEIQLTELKSTIECALTNRFKYQAKVQVFGQKKLANIVDAYPFNLKDTSTQHYVLFLENDLAPELINDAGQLDDALEAVALGAGVVYWRVKKGMTVKSPFSKLLVTPDYKDFNTNRNINTLQKILALATS